MASDVCFAVIADTPSRLVVGTVPRTAARHNLLGGLGEADHPATMIEAWDFDGHAERQWLATVLRRALKVPKRSE
jgi:hypothetical protein